MDARLGERNRRIVDRRYRLRQWLPRRLGPRDGAGAGTAAGGGGATAAAQTDGTQRTGILGLNGTTIALPANPVPTTYSNASAAAMGSQAATGSSVALGGATAYTGGITVWNSDTALPLFVGLGTITAAAGANKVCLGPGGGFHFVRGDLSAIQTITASGSPILNWVGYTS